MIEPHRQTHLPHSPGSPRLPEMPIAVRLALLLIAATSSVAVYRAWAGWQTFQEAGGESTNAVLRLTALSVAVFDVFVPMVLIAAMVKRKNWARVIQLLRSAWQLVSMLGGLYWLSSLEGNLPPAQAQAVLLSKVELVMTILATYLLFSAGGKAWFRRDDIRHA